MKHILFAVALLLSSLSAFAQYEVGTITIQPKVGLNVSSMNKLKNTSMRVSYTAGVEAEYQAWDLVSVSLGAMYSQQGYRHNYKSTLDGALLKLVCSQGSVWQKNIERRTTSQADWKKAMLRMS